MRPQLKRVYAIFAIIFFLSQPTAIKASGSDWLLSAADTIKYNGSGVRIGLIDTGVNCKYLEGSNIVDGKNYVFPERTENDLMGHGTAVAGIILGSEALKLEGVAAGAEIVPLVFYSRHTSGVPANGGINAICQAIYDAVNIYNCRIINISSGITADNSKLRKAIAYAEKKSVLVVSSVGNTNRSSPEDIYYPAAYETVVGVGAANDKKMAAEFSQRNASVKLLAHGTDIPTAPIDNSSELLEVTGSSYAAAFVTGCAALLLEANPELNTKQLRDILYSSADDLGAKGYDIETGWGMLDITKALSVAEKLYELNRP